MRKPCVLALIPVRAGSVRIPNKNLQKIGPHSLIERKIRQLQKSTQVTGIIVGTNCPETKRIAASLDVVTLDRDEFVCDEARATANDMIGNFVRRVEADIVVWAHCTNPFLYARHYDDALKHFFEVEEAGFDSLLSVYEVQSHMWNQFGFPANYNPYATRHALARDLPPVFFQDGGIFIQRHATMAANSYFFGRTPALYNVAFPHSHDINTHADLDIARLLSTYLDEKEDFQ